MLNKMLIKRMNRSNREETEVDMVEPTDCRQLLEQRREARAADSSASVLTESGHSGSESSLVLKSSSMKGRTLLADPPITRTIRGGPLLEDPIINHQHFDNSESSRRSSNRRRLSRSPQSPRHSERSPRAYSRSPRIRSRSPRMRDLSPRMMRSRSPRMIRSRSPHSRHESPPARYRSRTPPSHYRMGRSSNRRPSLSPPVRRPPRHHHSEERFNSYDVPIVMGRSKSPRRTNPSSAPRYAGLERRSVSPEQTFRNRSPGRQRDFPFERSRSRDSDRYLGSPNPRHRGSEQHRRHSPGAHQRYSSPPKRKRNSFDEMYEVRYGSPVRVRINSDGRHESPERNRFSQEQRRYHGAATSHIRLKSPARRGPLQVSIHSVFVIHCNANLTENCETITKIM